VAGGRENVRKIRNLGAEGTERSGAHNYHNHPSGIAEPSHADELITRRLREALQLIDVRVLDHLIIGDTCEYSFAETGRL
jgi:DNA repair protein RadC